MSEMGHDEQDQFREWIRSGLERVAPLERTRTLAEAGARGDFDLWSGLVDLDVFGFSVPEELGGTDLHGAGLRILLEEAGRCLLPAPYLSAAFLAPLTLRRTRGPRSDRLLTQIAKGQLKVGLVVPADASGLPFVATRDGSDWSLTGCSSATIDGDTADSWLVAAVTPTGPAVFVVDSVGGGSRSEVLRSLDLSRPVSRLVLESTPAALLADADVAGPVLEELVDLVRLALAADAVGGASRLLEMTVDYSRTRTQFGRPIGQFQALKHQCADLFVAIEGAHAMVDAAFEELTGESRPSPLAVMLAGTTALDAYALAASTAMQIHGGLAFTWEHDAHLYLKRSTASQHLLGNPDRELARLTDVVLADGFDVVETLLG